MIISHIALEIGLTIAAMAAGLLFGRLYFAALSRTVASFLGGKGWAGPLALTAGRIGGAVIFLLIVAQQGAAPLLGSVTGFLIARAIAVRARRRTP
jgi:hypothetical protein